MRFFDSRIFCLTLLTFRSQNTGLTGNAWRAVALRVFRLTRLQFTETVLEKKIYGVVLMVPPPPTPPSPSQPTSVVPPMRSPTQRSTSNNSALNHSPLPVPDVTLFFIEIFPRKISNEMSAMYD